ncbi:hypothetical protein PIROE2DRAFT_5928 [Piromyces sp. E2]|nr:hypothetical protein PIROE2DRAFT_5928 [Piromyces sp. E2]|eukprot:OUM66721.1 hypothetical protein PIROE2DRAFT_5928 [Piromyces sp. E2]
MDYPYDSITFKQIHDLLGKYLKVQLLSGFKTTKTESLEGYLYTIDPITKTLVLLKEKDNSEIEKEEKKEESDNNINNYQIIVIMKSVIQNISVNSKVEPLPNEVLATVIPDQNIIYLEKTDSIENLKESLINPAH